MGTRQRRLRELAEREQLFLDAAREQITEHGLLSLHMAKVARACDYATGTLYQHFASKEDLLLAICADQAEERMAVMARAAQWQTGSRERMIALAVADMLFAIRHPDHFRLFQYASTEVIWHAASPSRRDTVLEAHRPLGDMVAQVVQDGLDSGDLPPQNMSPHAVALGPWALTEGMHNLVNAEGVLDFYALHDPYRLLLRHLHLQLNGMQWQPLFDPLDDVALTRQISHICASLFDDLCPEGTGHRYCSPTEDRTP